MLQQYDTTIKLWNQLAADVLMTFPHKSHSFRKRLRIVFMWKRNVSGWWNVKKGTMEVIRRERDGWGKGGEGKMRREERGKESILKCKEVKWIGVEFNIYLQLRISLLYTSGCTVYTYPSIVCSMSFVLCPVSIHVSYCLIFIVLYVFLSILCVRWYVLFSLCIFLCLSFVY